MKLPHRRQFLHLAAGAAALPVLSRIARAQTYPSRPVHWIVGYTPGGGNDTFARLMGQWLQERLGQPFVIENRPGAGSNIATEAVVNARPDGYTILLANFANASNASLYANLKFNFIRDIAPVAGIVRVPNIMLVNQSLPVKTIPEFIAYAKANPSKISMASAGIGSTGHLAGFRRLERLRSMHDAEGRAINALMRTMRITHQARYHQTAAHVAARNVRPGPKPWETDNDDAS